MANSTLFAIGIGGTGAKCLESLMHLHAIGGLEATKLRGFLVDADRANGNGQRTQASLNIYQRTYNCFRGGSSRWMQGEVGIYPTWSPMGDVMDRQNLRSIFSYNALKTRSPELAGLMEALFTQQEMDADLEVGFRGRPAIGSAVMSRVSLDDHQTAGSWNQLLSELKGDSNNGVACQVIIFASVFGGTGAAGAPTICRMLKNHMDNLGIRQVPLGAVLMLPFFSFRNPQISDQEEIFARSENFLMNTEGALNYYARYSEDLFDTAYLLGNPSYTQYEFSLGNQNQRNQANILELYAAMAACRFSRLKGQDGRACIIGRQDPRQFSWEDLPETQETKSLLANAARFAHVWKYNISPELDQARSMGYQRFIKGAPWFTQYYGYERQGLMKLVGNSTKPRLADPQEQSCKEQLDEWVSLFINWLSQVMAHGENRIQLLRIGQDVPLSQLMVNSNLDEIQLRLDDYHHLRNQLEEVKNQEDGTRGLAHMLYTLTAQS